MSNKPHLILIRGIPGSGKSTFAQMLAGALDISAQESIDDPPCRHYENDDWFTSKDGTYKWYPEGVQEAVRWCQERTIRDLAAGFDVVVSNTFTKPSDYKWATDLCREKGYRLTVLTMEGDHGSIHNIPKDKMDYFRRNMRIPFRF